MNNAASSERTRDDGAEGRERVVVFSRWAEALWVSVGDDSMLEVARGSIRINHRLKFSFIILISG